MNTTQNADLMLIVERQGLMGPYSGKRLLVKGLRGIFLVKTFFKCYFVFADE
jgi:hypothetical protein